MPRKDSYTADEVYEIFRKPDEKRKLWALSLEYKVPYTSLLRRHHKFLHGQNDPDERFTMTPKQEKMLFMFILYLTRRKTPPTATDIRHLGAKMLGRKNMLSSNWFIRYMRHHEVLKKKKLKHLDAPRVIRENGEKLIEDFFEDYLELQATYGFDDDEIYNIDEAGFKIGSATEGATYIVPEEARHIKSYDSSERVTVVEVISKSGKVGLPMLIYKGKNVMAGWIPEGKLKTAVIMETSGSGFMNEKLFLKWLDFHFNKDDGKYRLLIMDGRSYVLYYRGSQQKIGSIQAYTSFISISYD